METVTWTKRVVDEEEGDVPERVVRRALREGASVAALAEAGVDERVLLAAGADVWAVAQACGGEVVEGCWVAEGSPWVVTDGHGPEEESSLEDASDAAEEYVDGGDWSSYTGTHWVHVYTWRRGLDSDGDPVRVEEHRHTVAVEPEAPECRLDAHAWCSPHALLGGLEDNPGVQGHGGGLLVVELCRHCGCRRTTDTWAQDPVTGEQGLTSVEYEEEAEEPPHVAADEALEALEALDSAVECGATLATFFGAWAEALDALDALDADGDPDVEDVIQAALRAVRAAQEAERRWTE